MKRVCQSHTKVKDHIDSYYANAQAKIVRGLFLNYGMRFCKMWSCDDKNKIKLGAPGEPLALATRNRSIWVPKTKDFIAADHDMCNKTSLTPSVVLDIICPEDTKLKNFYKGKATMILKDSQLEQSDSFRHVVELYKIYKGMFILFTILILTIFD